MNNKEFEQFVLDNGKEILRFCRMTCADREAGDELYQDTMLKLLSKMRSLDLGQNVRSYALSVSILLWKNKKKKYANRNRLIPMESMDRLEAEGNLEKLRRRTAFLWKMSALSFSRSWRVCRRNIEYQSIYSTPQSCRFRKLQRFCRYRQEPSKVA